MSKGNLQYLFCGLLFCLSITALIIACLAFVKKTHIRQPANNLIGEYSEVSVNNSGKLDFGSGGYYHVKAYGCTPWWNCRWDNTGDSECCNIKLSDGGDYSPSNCLGNGWTYNWHTDFCKEDDDGKLHISGNGGDTPYQIKSDGECWDPTADYNRWSADYCRGGSEQANFNIISAKGHVHDGVGGVGNGQEIYIDGWKNCATTAECVKNFTPAYLLTPI